MGRSIHKLEAGRYVRIAQLSAAALVVGAAAMWAADIPGLNRPFREPKEPEVPAPAAPAVIAQVARPSVFDRDTAEQVSVLLENATNHPKPKTGPVEPPPPPAPVQAADWKYLGPIYDGSTLRALVTVPVKDGVRQRVLREGAKVEDTQLVAISPEALTVKDAAGVSRQIRLLGGDGASVAWLRNVPGGRAGPGGMPGGPGMMGPGGAGAAGGAGQRLPSAGNAATRDLRAGGGDRRARPGEISKGDTNAAGTTDAVPAALDTAMSKKLDTSNDVSIDADIAGFAQGPLPPDLQAFQSKYLAEYQSGQMTMEELIKHLTAEYQSHGRKFDPSTIKDLISKMKVVR